MRPVPNRKRAGPVQSCAGSFPIEQSGGLVGRRRQNHPVKRTRAQCLTLSRTWMRFTTRLRPGSRVPTQDAAADPIHGRAQAAMIVERDNAFVFSGETLGQPIDQVNLGADRKGRPAGACSTSRSVAPSSPEHRLSGKLPAAFRMNDNLDAGYLARTASTWPGRNADEQSSGPSKVRCGCGRSFVL